MTTPTKSDYIKLKDLIIDLRNKYQETNKSLDKLKDHVYGIDSSIDDFYFYLKQTSEANPEVLIKFIEHRGLIGTFLDRISKFRGDFDYQRHLAKLWQDFNKHYKIIGHYPAKICDEREFTEKLTAVMNSEFCKNIRTPKIDVASNFMNGELIITTSEIAFYGQELESRKASNIVFNGREDTLRHQTQDSIIPLRRYIYLLNTLDAPVKISDLPEYHQSALSHEEHNLIIDQQFDKSLGDIDNYSFETIEEKHLLLKKKH